MFACSLYATQINSGLDYWGSYISSKNKEPRGRQFKAYMEMSSGMQAASNSLPSFDISYWDFFLWLPHEYDLHVLCLHSNRKKGEDQRTNVLWFFCLCAWCFIQQVGFISLARTMFNICLLMQGRLGKLLPWTKKEISFYSKKEANVSCPNCTHHFLSCSPQFILHSTVIMLTKRKSYHISPLIKLVSIILMDLLKKVVKNS